MYERGGDEKPRPRGDGEVDARCDGQGGHHLKSPESHKTARGVLKKGDGESAIVNRLTDSIMMNE